MEKNLAARIASPREKGTHRNALRRGGERNWGKLESEAVDLSLREGEDRLQVEPLFAKFLCERKKVFGV